MTSTFFRQVVLISTAVLSILPGTCLGNVRLPTLVGDNMVLQRDAKITLWGWADRGEKVTIEFRQQRANAKAGKDGRWSAQLGPFSAGGPYEMTVKGNNTLHLHNIALGDVWLASGQSNMEFPVKASGEWRTGVINAEMEIARANHPDIRLFLVKHGAALKPMEDANSDGWHAVTPQTVGDFSAVAYLFGREIHERHHVPVGIIESNWGGTVAEAWMSEAALKPFPEFRAPIDAVSRVDAAMLKAYQDYKHRREAWYRQHGAEDRGRVGDRNLWADPDLETKDWPTIAEPRPNDEWGKDFRGFDGVVWLRRKIYVTPDLAGKTSLLKISGAVKDDETFFNGEKIGSATDYSSREYVIPGEYVHAGPNVIAVRLLGVHSSDRLSESGVGIFGSPEEINLEIGSTTLPLAGTWYYHPGPELHDYPVAAPTLLAAEPTPDTPTELFNGMINPLVKFRIKGVIWYQGESNARDGRAVQYRSLFPALIYDWREQWGYTLPFLFVQIAGYGPEQPEDAECQWAELREAQAMALSLPGTGMATAVDIGDANNIHPRNKQDVAHRLALVAARVVYGEDIVYSGPTYQSFQVEGNRIRIKFSNVGSGLSVRDKYGYARGFELAGSDNRFMWAQAQQDGPDIVVYNDAIRHPSTIRYDWSNTPDGNVFNNEGLPALPFRANVASGQ